MVFSRIISEAKHNHGASITIKSRARELRKVMTEAEKILWNRLRKKQQNGMYFRRQHPFGIYIIDFYCFKANLAIEVDGEIHLRHKEYDEERTRSLQESGLKVIRFSNHDILNRPDWVINVVKKCSGQNNLPEKLQLRKRKA